MLLENLKELKKVSGMTFEDIADESKTPESTIKRIFSGKCEPLASTLYRIVKALGGSLDDILADTNVILSPKTLAEVKENAEIAEAERDLVLVENERLKAENNALTTQIELLKRELQHKEELLALHNYYIKLNKTVSNEKTPESI